MATLQTQEQTSSNAKSEPTKTEVTLPSASATPTPIHKLNDNNSKLPSLNQQTLDINKPYQVKPHQGYEAANNLSPYSIIAVNGMNMRFDSINKMAQNLANVFGKNVKVIPNNTDGLARDIKNSVASVFNDSKGLEAEKVCAGNLKTALVERLNDNQSIELVGYSQGTLIIEDVLANLKTQMKPQAWKSFASRINLRTYGAANRIWPKGIVAKEHRHLGDGVAAIGTSASAIERTKNLFRGQGFAKRAKVTRLPAFKKAHCISNYLENNAKFFLKEISKETPLAQSKKILSSIRNGEFSNQQYDKLIAEVTNPALNRLSDSKDHNHSVMLSRELYANFAKYPNAINAISEESLERVMKVAKTEIIERKQKPSIAQRRQRPGSFR